MIPNRSKPALNEPYVLTHLQNRNKVLEVYTEQSLETMQQHISTLNTELTKYRSVATLASTLSNMLFSLSLDRKSVV